MITNTKIARKFMLEGQCFTNNVTDPNILRALKSVPREIFVPDAYAESAYIDEDIPLTNGRALLQPLVFARMLQLAQINKSFKVLDIGCCTGYSSAVISLLAKEVVALESDSELTAGVSVNLNKLNIENVTATAGDLLLGAAEYKPYDLIIIEGMIEYIPETIIKQLKVGGRIVAVMVENSIGNIVVATKNERGVNITKHFQANSYRLEEFSKARSFNF